LLNDQWIIEEIREKMKRFLGRWQLEGGKESVPPIVKSWRDTGDTPCKQNYPEEAKH
jgi:hypothetical protein